MPVTEDMVEAAWRREQEPVAQLLTLRSDADPAPITVTDWKEGVTSNGVAYAYFPFELAWASSSRDQVVGQGKLTIANVDRRIEEACDAAVNPPELDLMLVRVDEPDVVERAILGAKVPSVDGDARTVNANIRPRSFAEEPACAVKQTPSTTPALF